MKKVSIVIVNWNTEKLIKKCLQSIKKSKSYSLTETYVVDNDSKDNSVAIIKKEFPWVKLIANKKNVGFGKANNQVLKKIKTDYAFILNPDTEVLENTVSELLKFLENHKQINVCSPLLLNKDGSVQQSGYFRRFPSLMQVLFFYTDLNRWSLKKESFVQKYWEQQFNLNKEYFYVDQIPGASTFARTKVLKKINFFDESFPLWFEDVDMCFRLKQINERLVVVTGSKLYHLGGGAFQKWHDDKGKQIRFYKSLFHFFDQHKSRLSRIAVRLIIFTDLFLLVSRKRVKQLVSANEERRLFIQQKKEVLLCLLSAS